MPAERKVLRLCHLGQIDAGLYFKRLSTRPYFTWWETMEFLLSVPEEARQDAEVELFWIYYDRMETQQEADAREEGERAKQTKIEGTEKIELARLLKKYGAPSRARPAQGSIGSSEGPLRAP